MVALSDRQKRRDKETFYVYAMFDPRDNHARYIGVSNNPERRVKHHTAHQHSDQLKQWIAGLKADGVRPGFRILDEVCGQLWAHWAEKWWIGMYSFVCPGQLLNKYWLVQFQHRYHLEQSAKAMRIQKERELYEGRWLANEKARVTIRKMLRAGRSDVKEMAAECGVRTVIVWEEIRMRNLKKSAV